MFWICCLLSVIIGWITDVTGNKNTATYVCFESTFGLEIHVSKRTWIKGNCLPFKRTNWDVFCFFHSDVLLIMIEHDKKNKTSSYVWIHLHFQLRFRGVLSWLVFEALQSPPQIKFLLLNNCWMTSLSPCFDKLMVSVPVQWVTCHFQQFQEANLCPVAFVHLGKYTLFHYWCLGTAWAPCCLWGPEHRGHCVFKPHEWTVTAFV